MQESERAESINRRSFLRRMTVGAAAVSAALVVGEEMFEAFARLAPRNTYWSLSGSTYANWQATTGEAHGRFSYSIHEIDWASILQEDYMKGEIVNALAVATPFRKQMLRRNRRREPRPFGELVRCPA